MMMNSRDAKVGKSQTPRQADDDDNEQLRRKGGQDAKTSWWWWWWAATVGKWVWRRFDLIWFDEDELKRERKCVAAAVNEWSPRASLGSFFFLFILKIFFFKLILKLINIQVRILGIRVRLKPEPDPDMCGFVKWVPDSAFLYIRVYPGSEKFAIPSCIFNSHCFKFHVIFLKRKFHDLYLHHILYLWSLVFCVRNGAKRWLFPHPFHICHSCCTFNNVCHMYNVHCYMFTLGFMFNA